MRGYFKTKMSTNGTQINTKINQCPKWLDIYWKEKIVRINAKGKIRGKKTK